MPLPYDRVWLVPPRICRHALNHHHTAGEPILTMGSPIHHSVGLHRCGGRSPLPTLVLLLCGQPRQPILHVRVWIESIWLRRMHEAHHRSRTLPGTQANPRTTRSSVQKPEAGSGSLPGCCRSAHRRHPGTQGINDRSCFFAAGRLAVPYCSAISPHARALTTPAKGAQSTIIVIYYRKTTNNQVNK